MRREDDEDEADDEFDFDLGGDDDMDPDMDMGGDDDEPEMGMDDDPEMDMDDQEVGDTEDRLNDLEDKVTDILGKLTQVIAQTAVDDMGGDEDGEDDEFSDLDGELDDMGGEEDPDADDGLRGDDEDPDLGDDEDEVQEYEDNLPPARRHDDADFEVDGDFDIDTYGQRNKNKASRFKTRWAKHRITEINDEEMMKHMRKAQNTISSLVRGSDSNHFQKIIAGIEYARENKDVPSEAIAELLSDMITGSMQNFHD